MYSIGILQLPRNWTKLLSVPYFWSHFVNQNRRDFAWVLACSRSWISYIKIESNVSIGQTSSRDRIGSIKPLVVDVLRCFGVRGDVIWGKVTAVEADIAWNRGILCKHFRSLIKLYSYCLLFYYFRFFIKKFIKGKIFFYLMGNICHPLR